MADGLMLPKPIEAQGQDTLLRVRVQPKASRDALIRTPEGALRVALTAPPVEGQANKALVKFMAGVLGIPKRSLVLAHGEKSRDKVLCVKDVEARVVAEKIQAVATAKD